MSQIFGERPLHGRARRLHKEFETLLGAQPARPWTTYSLIAVNVIVFLICTRATLLFFDADELISFGGNYGPRTVGAGEWWRLISCTFLHVDVVHILANMMALYWIGEPAERLYGKPAFLWTYLLAGIGGSICGLALHPQIVSVGASGAVFGVFGALIASMKENDRIIPRHVHKAVISGAVAFLFFNLVWGLLQPAIDNAAHVGGAGVGYLVGRCVARPLGRPANNRRRVLAGTAAALVLTATAAGVFRYLISSGSVVVS